jgi:crotonobetainyl-CoA:carnitine CoA-transferase CaiB-like acyl-CoA transferase
VCDIACGLTAHAAVLEALIERAQTGKGKGLHVSMFDALAEWMTVPLLHQEGTGQAPARVGVAHPSIQPYGAYPTADDGEVVIAIQNDREWRRFCDKVLGKPELGEHASYANNVSRCENREAMNEEITAVTSTCSEADLRDKLFVASIAFASLNDLLALSEHPHLRRHAVATPSGSARLVAPAARTNGETFSSGAIPALNEHGNALRAEFAKVR